MQALDNIGVILTFDKLKKDQGGRYGKTTNSYFCKLCAIHELETSYEKKLNLRIPYNSDHSSNTFFNKDFCYSCAIILSKIISDIHPTRSATDIGSISYFCRHNKIDRTFVKIFIPPERTKNYVIERSGSFAVLFCQGLEVCAFYNCWVNENIPKNDSYSIYILHWKSCKSLQSYSLSIS